MRLKLLLGFLIILFISTLINGFFFYRENTNNAIIAVSISVLCALLVSSFLSWYYTREITKLVSYAERMATGELDIAIQIQTKDEVYKLGQAFGKMVQYLSILIGDIRNISRTINDASQQLTAFSQEMNASTEEISSSVQSIAAGAENQARSAEKVVGITRKNSEIIKKLASRSEDLYKGIFVALERAKKGVENISYAINDMESMFNYFENTITSMRGFEKKTEEIEGIVKIITNIAMQTHILSINATIEAARAGEYGEGFAVVAEEIRKLAEESKNSANRIAQISTDINQNSAKIISEMGTSIKVINKGKFTLRDINKQLQDIFGSVLSKAKDIQNIAEMSTNQLVDFQEIVHAVSDISKVAEDNAASTQEATATTQEQTASMQELVSSIQELYKLSEKLNNTINRFKLNEG